MFLYRVKFHILANWKKLFLKIYHGKTLKLGKMTTWRRRFDLWIEKSGTLEIGKDCFFNNDCSITCFGNITIGDNTIFGENVKIYDQNHKFSDLTTLFCKQGYTIGEVHIGKNCWIGSNVIILKGANIGDNCVIGAGCKISGDIPEGHIVRINTHPELIKIDLSFKKNSEGRK